MAVSVWLRMLFYGVHGFFDEILFTSLFNFVESNFQDWRFRGHSSLLSFFMYGFGNFVIYWATVPELERQMVFANACTGNNLRFVAVRMGIQLRYGSETFCSLSLGLQQSPVELVWPDNFAVFSCLARCKCVSRICCTISSNTFQRHKPRQTERVLTSRTQEVEKRALLVYPKWQPRVVAASRSNVS